MTNDQRIQNELLYRLRDVPTKERDNAVKILQAGADFIGFVHSADIVAQLEKRNCELTIAALLRIG